MENNPTSEDAGPNAAVHPHALAAAQAAIQDTVPIATDKPPLPPKNHLISAESESRPANSQASSRTESNDSEGKLCINTADSLPVTPEGEPKKAAADGMQEDESLLKTAIKM